MDLISITDHDTADAYTQIPDNILPLVILPGMEISSLYKGDDVHILAYGCDFNNPALRASDRDVFERQKRTFQK